MFQRRRNAQIIGRVSFCSFLWKHLGWKTSDGGKNSTSKLNVEIESEGLLNEAAFEQMQIQLWLETITNRVLFPMQNISLIFQHSESYVFLKLYQCKFRRRKNTCFAECGFTNHFKTFISKTITKLRATGSLNSFLLGLALIHFPALLIIFVWPFVPHNLSILNITPSVIGYCPLR